MDGMGASRGLTTLFDETNSLTRLTEFASLDAEGEITDGRLDGLQSCSD